MRNQGRFFSRLTIFISLILVSTQVQAELKGPYVAGEYIVKMKDSVGAFSAQQMGAMMAPMAAKIKSEISKKQRTMVVQQSLLVRPEAAIEQLQQLPGVEFVEPNYIYRASQLPNDSRLDDLWGLVNQNKSSGGVDIDAAAAWGITTGDKDIVVAVIDTGVNYNHPDLKNNMWVNQAEANGQTGVDDDGNGFIDDIHGYDFANNDGDPMDDNDHGTHCAGTIGAEGDNGIGVVGVNWKVSIMGLKFLTGTGGGTLEDALKSIDYATQMGVDVMSNSWGGGGESQTLREAIERAEQAGILFVAAAGNASNNNDAQPSYPANYDVPNVISVAAISDRGDLASFSNYGKNTVHIAAPGVNVLSTTKSGGYKQLSGTSMATPHVSGVAALLLAKEPHLSYSDLKTRLLATSEPSAKLRNKVSHGVLNAYNALTNTIPPPDANDPSNWPSVSQNHSTDHPYANDVDESYVVTVPGATKVAVHFSKFELERGFDKVHFFDGSGQKIGEMTGNQDNNYSPVAVGDTIVLQFKSDYSVNAYGFDVDAVHYQGQARSEWQTVEDPVSTSHPYRNHMDEQAVFEQPGASEIRVKFGKFEMEKGYDSVLFYDGAGRLLAEWDGDHSGEVSPTAEGDKIVVRIKTDYSVRKYGFDIESVQYR